jgi:outer membrane protein OmpA-like peptidoglycan-associated protein
MRLGLIVGIFCLTALLFYGAIQSISRHANGSVEGFPTQVTANQTSLEQDLEDQISELQSQLSILSDERQSLEVEIANHIEEVSKVETLKVENGILSETITTLQSDLRILEETEAKNLKLASETLEMSRAIAALEADLTSLRAGETGMDDLMAEKDALSQDLLTAQIELTALSGAVLQSEDVAANNDILSAEIAGLQSELVGMRQATIDADTTISALNETIETSHEDNIALKVKLSELQSAIAASSQLDSTEAGALETELTTLQSSIVEKTEALVVADENIEALSQRITALVEIEDDLVETEETVAALRADIAVRDLAILELRGQEQPASSSHLQSCQKESNAALIGEGIAFQPGTTRLAPSAISQLENISTIAVECAKYNLVLDIEGHTDGEGGDASNLLLSNGRAKAVYDFLAGHGVPPTAMRAVGFGKSDPVVDSVTADGRAKNERIIFDWEQS